MSKIGQTLLVIGAGAHVPYSMPTGAQLRNSIKDIYRLHGGWLPADKPTSDRLYEQNEKLINIAIRMKFVSKVRTEARFKEGSIPPNSEVIVSPTTEKKYLFDFIESFCESHVTSIDTYMSTLEKLGSTEQAQIFQRLGKLIIAFLISEAERDTYIGSRNDDWIHFVINEFIRPDYKLFFKTPLKIITFNYDRLLERMLLTHLTEFHRIDTDEALELIKSLNIIHVYGSLGDFKDWYRNFEKNHLSFYDEAIKNILVVGEDRSETSLNAVRKSIHDMIIGAHNIYFLGYGFDAINNNLLFGQFSRQVWHEHTKIYSTSIGITKSNKLKIESALSNANLFQLIGGKVVEHDSKHLLSEIAPLTFL